MRVERNAPCRVDRDEAFRYLGYSGQEVSDELMGRIEAGIELCERVSRPMWCHHALPGDGGGFSPGASEVAYMACTIGVTFDREARRLAMADSQTVEALAFDAAGSALVEACADACERDINRCAAERGLFAGQRMSPGYGDIPLGFSASIIRCLEADKRLGISLTDVNLLVPQKSVTAFVGLFEREDDARAAHRSCADCIARFDCAYLKAGNVCHKT